jgi:hypothetical protein
MQDVNLLNSAYSKAVALIFRISACHALASLCGGRHFSSQFAPSFRSSKICDQQSESGNLTVSDCDERWAPIRRRLSKAGRLL